MEQTNIRLSAAAAAHAAGTAQLVGRHSGRSGHSRHPPTQFMARTVSSMLQSGSGRWQNRRSTYSSPRRCREAAAGQGQQQIKKGRDRTERRVAPRHHLVQAQSQTGAALVLRALAALPPHARWRTSVRAYCKVLPVPGGAAPACLPACSPLVPSMTCLRESPLAVGALLPAGHEGPEQPTPDVAASLASAGRRAGAAAGLDRNAQQQRQQQAKGGLQRACNLSQRRP